MYADRYGAGAHIKPGSTMLALIGTAAPIVALVLGLQITNTIIKTPPLIGVNVVQPKPPEPDPVRVQPQKPIDQKIYVPPQPNPLPLPPSTIDLTPTAPTTVTPPIQPGTGTVIAPVEPVVILKPPVMVNAQIDSRSALQPPYPAEEIRAGRNGRVSLRVLVGPDGRVKQVVRVSATTDAFYAAAERQALNKWRFKPATKDGAAIEQWKVMNLSFVLNEE